MNAYDGLPAHQPPSASAPDPAPDPRPGPGPGQTLFEFVRHWARRWNSPGDGPARQQGRHVLVTEAVRSLDSRGIVTINAVAHEIGIDQSGASRMVKDAVAAGYLEIKPSESDTRRREVTVTAAGLDLLHDAHHWQEAVFDQLSGQWTDQQRTEFHHAMFRLLERSHTLDTDGHARPDAP
ncbi:MarR family transcriptional regulator [Streptomyces sp. SID4919]|nr:MarR family transcriptional regulator [Streptomyces sp. SID4919]SCK11488.1 transcriptional regulator, MarR family [Streptomyces sp. AmelKG-E11A]